MNHALVCIASCLVLSGCWFGDVRPTQDTLLCTAECPASLGELSDSSFGATVRKLKEVADTYHTCRCACLNDAASCQKRQEKPAKK